jgi:hypothetical protein
MVDQSGGETRVANNIIKNAKEELKFPRPSLIHSSTRIINILVLKSRRLLKGCFIWKITIEDVESSLK